ncbi:unnamed protein product, partial [Polarella glacialis]
KVRPCDDGDGGEHTALTADDNKLELCDATQPATHIRAVQNAASEQNVILTSGVRDLQTGGEDWPDAYRYTPFRPEQCLMAVVIFWHAEWKCPALCIYRGLLFGLSGAVIAFNRFSKFVQHMGRRLLFIVLSMYFDDASLQDWTSSRESAQSCLSQLVSLLGRPWAPAKRQEMASTGDFLGLTHDLGRAAEGVKMFGMWNFLETGLFGHLGRAGLTHLRLRQRKDPPPYEFNDGLAKLCQMLSALLSIQPKRTIRIKWTDRNRFLAASDAAADESSAPTGGFLLVFHPGPRLAAVPDLTADLADCLDPGVQKIAQWELMQVMIALITYPEWFRNRAGFWFIDNINGLIALVKGRSGVPDLDHLAMAAILTIATLSKRLEPLSDQLRTLQPPSVASVSSDMHLALVAALIMVMQWTDTRLCFEFCFGFKVLGNIPNCGVYAPTNVPPLDEKKILQGSWEHAMRLRKRVKPGEHDELLTKATLKDVAQGFADSPVTWEQFLNVHKPGTFRLIKRFPVTQSTGKVRPCDDGDGGEHTALAADDNKLELCDATQPATHIRAVQNAASEQNVILTSGVRDLQTGGEDWPDAYRYTPFRPEQHLMAVVIFWHAEWKCPALCIYRGLLFGLSGAVIAFNRFSKFVQHMGRRLLFILLSMYFDDASLQDWTSSRESAQSCLSQLVSLLGRPWAPAKRQEMASAGDFLGLAAKMFGMWNFLPKRTIRIKWTDRNRFLAASDAAADESSAPTGGFLLVFHPGPRLAAVPDLTADLADCLDPGVQKIAQWELMQVMIALITYPEWFRNRAGFWFIDNINGLIALVKGDPWRKKHGFAFAPLCVPLEVFQMDLHTMLKAPPN